MTDKEKIDCLAAALIGMIGLMRSANANIQSPILTKAITLSQKILKDCTE
jgi:hypothetical protein